MSDIEWIKITTSGYRNPKLCKIREMKDGNECCLFWYLLLQRAGECNDSGRVWITEDIPYSLKDLSKTFNFSQKKIQKFLEIFSEFFMIFLDISHENICKISIINWEKYQNENKLQQIRENQKQRVARHREKLKKELEQNCNVTCNVTVTDNQPLQNRYSNALDIRNKNIEQDIHEEEVHEEDSSDEKKSEISSSDDVGLYGQYGNVCLTKKQYQKMLGICMSQKFLDELISALDEDIGMGKKENYKAEHPDAHFILLQRYYDFRKKNPEKFSTSKAYGIRNKPSACSYSKAEESAVSQAIRDW